MKLIECILLFMLILAIWLMFLNFWPKPFKQEDAEICWRNKLEYSNFFNEYRCVDDKFHSQSIGKVLFAEKIKKEKLK